eukprot:COSAG01_NODE_1424_length_10352_cov_3.066517_7_plen_93_part_00
MQAITVGDVSCLCLVGQLDYNQEAQFYGVYGSNHPAQAASYFKPITDWMPNARAEAASFVAHLNLTRPSCKKALHFSCHLAPWGLQSTDTTI